MEPINYMLNVPNPASAVFEGYAQGLNTQAAQQQMAQAAAQEARAAELQPFAVEGAQLGLDQTRQGMDIRGAQEARAAQLAPLQQQQAQLGIQNTQQQMAQRQQEQQRAAQFQGAMGELAQRGGDMTLADIQGVVTRFPEYGESVVGSFQAMNDAQRDAVSGVLGQAAFALKNGSTETALDLIDEYAAAAAASGNEELAATAQGIKMVAEQDPNAALAAIGPALFSLDPDMAGKIFDAGSARVQTTVNVGPKISVQTMSNGETRVVDTTTNEVLTGEVADAAIEAARAGEIDFTRQTNAARQEGTLQTQAELGAAAAGARKAGEIGQAVGLEAFEKVGQIRANIGTLDAVVDAIDNGARSGQIESRFPTWNADTIALRNLGNQLGLDVVGSVTFGALSEGELRLAMQTALPTQMDEAELKQWVLDKKAAQEKLLGYMEQQARFLARPGNTIEKWLEVVDSQEGASTPAQQSAPQAAQPAVPSYLQQFGGQ